MNFFGTKEIKPFVEKWIFDNKDFLKGKFIVDIPAGNGTSSTALLKVGANVQAFDLFPEFFRVKELSCKYADLGQALPLDDQSVDLILCQEGVEHISDQVLLFSEFSRVLKVGGMLLLTTPNYSNLRSRLSYLLSESEFYGKIAPPNEFESVWFQSLKNSTSKNEQGKNINKKYFGHVFLLGIQKIRFFSLINGFEIKKIIPTRVNNTSLFFFLFLYPFIFLSNYKIKRKFQRTHGIKGFTTSKTLFQFGTSPQILLDNNLFIIFTKISSEKMEQNLKWSFENQSTNLDTFVT